MHSVALLITSVITYLVLLAIHRFVFHPLAKVPGPKLAAISGFYMTYYDLIMLGGMVEQLESLHEKYGPVVRIAPGKLHFNDPQAYDEIYRSKFIKEAWFYNAFVAPESSFASIDTRKAKMKKDAMRPLFSRKAILKLENVIQRSVDKFIQSLSKYQDRPVALHHGYLSISMEHPLMMALGSSGFTLFLIQHFPFLAPFILGMPRWLAELFSRDSLAFQDFFAMLEAQIDKIVGNPTLLESGEHATIYHHLIGEGTEVKESKKALRDESAVLVGAGTDTLGNAYKLVCELRAAWTDLDSPLGLEKLEKLPYLTAVIKESLRLSYGVVSPLPRVVPFETVIAGIPVPSGTVVAMGATFMHNNPNIFINPKKFDPDRWLQPNTRELEENLAPFSRGSRSCLGVNLAWAELYLIFSNVFRKTDLELFETTEDDLQFSAFMSPRYRGRQMKVYAKVLET